MDDASDPEVLIEAFRGAVNGFMHEEDTIPGLSNPSPRPHGRLAWSIYTDPKFNGPYLDISVMPRLGQPADGNH